MKWRAILMLSAALVCGVAGYAVTGHPKLPSAVTRKTAINPDLTPAAEKASRELLEHFGDVRAWLTLSDALIRANRTETSVEAMQTALRAIPGNADLWVQLGIALVAHAQGEVVPAARLAFDRASRLAPEHPAPDYFLGLAWMQAGNVEQALKTWEALRARSAADAPWVPMLDQQIAAAKEFLRMQAEGGMPEMIPAA